MSSSEAAAAIRKYRGIRMRKWGKWVAEIREPNKRSRIWLGSYSTPVAAARAYDTAVFFLRGKSARLNFPEEINKEPEAAGVLAGSSGGLSAASIRQKAAEVGARVDALHAGTGAGGAEQRQRQHRNSNRVKKEEDMDEDDDEDVRLAAQMAASKVASTTTTTTTSAVLWKKPDLNRQPSPECSDYEEY